MLDKTQTSIQQAETDQRASDLRTDNLYVLVTSVQGSLMAAVHTTREGAMAAAVDWVQGEAETRLTGTLIERYERARRFVKGQGGRMEIILSPVWTAVT